MSQKPRNNGQWTEARFRSFITSCLRRATNRWGPKNLTLQEARVSKGVYRCAGCKEDVPVTVKLEGHKRTRNVFVDHIYPIIDPQKGFTTWDEYIERMFCEKSGLQVLCKDCHDKKTAQERQEAKERKNK